MSSQDALSNEGFVIESLLHIADKEGNDVPFILNSAQRQIDYNLSGRDLIPKARQEGVSSYFLARYAMKCLHKRNTHAVVISHDAESTERMLKKVKYYLNHMVPAPVIASSSSNMITFPKTDSMFYIGTAGSRKFGRGDTISDLHCSEYAYWPNPEDLLRGLFQAVPRTGEIAIESTGNGYNDYHKRCMRAFRGESKWACHFLPWHTFEEYTLEISDFEAEEILNNLDPDLEEEMIADQLTAGQIAWRRMKLDELNGDLRGFKQEYPMTLDECFQASGQSIFHKVFFFPTPRWQRYDRDTFILEGHPRKDLHYVNGSDVAAGVEKDSSVIEGICLETNEQVMEYRSNKIAPDTFAHKVAMLGELFNFAYQVVENNNHGILTVAVLKELYPPGLIHHTLAPATPGEEKKIQALGYRTTVRSKPLMIGKARKALADGFVIHSVMLRDELSTFIEDEHGKLGAQSGCYDDTVMGLACALMGLTRAGIQAAALEEERQIWRRKALAFDFEDMIQELRSNNEKPCPISDQVVIGW